MELPISAPPEACSGSRGPCDPWPRSERRLRAQPDVDSRQRGSPGDSRPHLASLFTPNLPTVAAGCTAGLITADQLALIAPITTPANLAAAAAQDIDLAVIDQALADVATGERYDRLAQVVHHYLSALDPDGPEPDPTENRSLHITRHDDGSRSLRGGLDPVGGEK